jgi:hypothetical protein
MTRRDTPFVILFWAAPSIAASDALNGEIACCVARFDGDEALGWG